MVTRGWGGWREEGIEEKQWMEGWTEGIVFSTMHKGAVGEEANSRVHRNNCMFQNSC